MAVLVVMAFLLSMVGHSSASWCVCKEGVGDAQLQKTLDYACGAGADCTPTHQGGACFNPNTVRAHCNYAVNSFFQKKGQAPGSCEFAGTAAVTTSDPSSSGCAYPSSASSTSTTPVTTTPSTNTPTTTTPTTSTTPSTGTTGTTPSTSTTPVGGSSPYLTTPNGVLGPSGSGINTDVSHSEPAHQRASSFSFLMGLIFSAFMFLRG